jgi:hypothetical protein
MGLSKVKIGNEYQRVIGRLAEECPKAVLAAIAVSYASAGGDHLARAEKELAWEWQCLYDNGIVPQNPPARVRELAEAFANESGMTQTSRDFAKIVR